ncbi:MAG: hypothetical protein MUO72_13935 [Bacteroidales bacterium]|nr:hypothetical protein [Bacteroidales bacterium]
MKSNFEGYNNFIELFCQLQDSSDNDFIISLENTEVFEANLSAILGAIIDSALEQQKKVELVEIRRAIKDVFELNNFIIKSIPNLNTDHKGTVISFMKFTRYKDIEFMEYVKNEMLSKPDFPKHSKMLGKKINESIFELFENASTHGHCKNIYTCGQIIQDDEITRLDFTIVDMGKTIKNNVNEYLNQNFSGSEAIEWALESGHTTKTGNVSGGLGLDIIFEFIKLNKGKIQIVSSEGFWEYYNNKIEKKLFNNPFNGTIANIEFNLNDKNSYLLKEEIPLEDIF